MLFPGLVGQTAWLEVPRVGRRHRPTHHRSPRSPAFYLVPASETKGYSSYASWSDQVKTFECWRLILLFLEVMCESCEQN